MGYKKQLNLSRIAFRNIQIYRGRTISILIAISITIGMLSAVDFLREGINRDIDASLAFSPDILIQGYDSGRVTLINDSNIKLIEQVEGVTLVSPRVWGYLSAADNLYTMMGIEIDVYPLDSAELNFNIRSGRFLTANESHPVCVIGSGVADASYAQIGSYLLLTDINGDEYEMEVIGIFSVASKIYTHDLILTDILYSKEFFNVDENHSTDLTVWLSPDTQINSASIALEISNVAENIKILEKRSMGDIMHHSTNERAGIFILIWNVILIGTLLFAFTISSAVSVDSRREIGLLKSMGFTTMDVLEIRLLEFTMTGFIASTIGLFGAIIYDFYLGAPILADYMLGWSVLFPPFILPLRISIDILIIAYSMGIIPLVIATVVPAWKNAIRDPDELLRGL